MDEGDLSLHKTIKEVEGVVVCGEEEPWSLFL